MHITVLNPDIISKFEAIEKSEGNPQEKEFTMKLMDPMKGRKSILKVTKYYYIM